MTQHLDPASLDTFEQQLSETPTTLQTAGINDEYCWNSNHPMGWDCAVCRLEAGLQSFFEAVAMYATARINGGIDMWMWAETPDGQPYMGGYTVPPGADNLTLEVWAKNLLRHYPQAVKVTLWQQNIEAPTSRERCNYAIGEWHIAQ